VCDINTQSTLFVGIDSKVVGKAEETGDVTWSLMARRASDKVNSDADGSTTACVDDEEAQQPAAAAAAAETETTETTPVGDRSNVNR